MTIFDHFREAGRIGRGIFSLCATAVMEGRTIYPGELGAKLWRKKGEVYKLASQGRETYHLAHKTYEDFIDAKNPVRIPAKGMVLLLDYEFYSPSEYSAEKYIMWHVFHLEHQRNYWIYTPLEPVEDDNSLETAIKVFLDNVID